jgi:hypothetical protein
MATHRADVIVGLTVFQCYQHNYPEIHTFQSIVQFQLLNLGTTAQLAISNLEERRQKTHVRQEAQKDAKTAFGTRS